jgi:hypothetical protein
LATKGGDGYGSTGTAPASSAAKSARWLEAFGLALSNVNGLAAIYAIVAVVLWCVNGSDWFGKTILPIHALVVCFLFLTTFFLLIPLMVIKATRPYAAITVFAWSYIFGGITWFYTAHYCLVALGTFWLLVGLFVGGIGVTPVALIGSIILGDWPNLLFFGILLIVTFGCRGLSLVGASHS